MGAGCAEGRSDRFADIGSGECEAVFDDLHCGVGGVDEGGVAVEAGGVGQFGVGQLGHNYSYVVIYGFWRALVLKCR